MMDMDEDDVGEKRKQVQCDEGFSVGWIIQKGDCLTNVLFKFEHII